MKKGSALLLIGGNSSLKLSQIKEIAKVKMPDLNCYDIDMATNIIKGQCRSMGIDVIEG